MKQFTLLAVLLASSLASGQIVAANPAGTPPPDEIRTVRLALRPAAAPPAALKYQLLPPFGDRRQGNAALGYYKAILLTDNAKKVDKAADWLELPIEKFPRAEVRDALAAMRQVLDEIDAAARRNHCDWELAMGERDDPFSYPLPELQRMRELARLVALQAKLQIAEGKFDDAVHTLQTGYAMGRHVSQQQTIVHGLVGIAICQLMSARVEELLQLSDAPNLYWTLTMLPQPLAELRPGLEAELNIFNYGLPVLRNLDRSRNDPAYWQGVADQVAEAIAKIGVVAPQAGWRGMETLLAVKAYPAARRLMMERGHSAAEVDAMPVIKVVLLSALDEFFELHDLEFKWFFVPYWEAAPGLAQAQRYVQNEGRSREISPLARLALTDGIAVRFQDARNDRSIAILRTVEALRLYGAAHDGRLPEKLADIKEVPLPIDPITGHPFAYSKSGDMAVLDAPAPADRAKNLGVRMEIRFK